MTVEKPSMCGRCPSHRALLCAAAAACGRAGPRRAGALAVAWLLLAASAGGQDAVPADRHAPTSAEIQEILKQVEADAALAPDVKARITDEYKKALDALRRSEDWARKAALQAEASAGAPDELERLRTLLAEPAPAETLDVPADATLKQLQQRLDEVEAQLDDARKKSTDAAAARQSRGDRRGELRGLITETETKLSQLPAEPAADPSAPPAVAEASHTAFHARRAALESELRACQAELDGFDIRGELLGAQEDFAARESARLETLVKAWRDIVGDRRKLEEDIAARTASETAPEGQAVHPVIQALQEENAALIKQRAKANLSSEITLTDQVLDNVQRELDGVKTSASSVRAKVEAAGLTQAMGLRLRRQRDLLPDLRAHRRDLDDLRAKMSSAQVQLIDLREQRTQLPALENSVLQGLELQQGPAAEGETQDLAAQVRQLFRERRDLIEVLEAEYDVYSKKLGDLDSDQRALVTATEQFLGYIDERILWIRSGDWFGRRDLTRALEALLWLFHWDNWSQTVPTMTLTAQQHPLAATLVLAVIAILLIVRPQLQHILRTVGEEAEKKTSRRILPTMRAVWVTFLLAALVPLLVWYVGWLLVVPLRASEFCRGLGGALRVVAGVLLLCAFLRYAFIPGGLGSAHFGWNERSLKALRAAINRLLPWVLPLVLLTAARGLREEWQNSLGRLALTAMMGLVALAAFRVLRASGVIMQQARAQTPPGWVLRTRWIWLALGIGLPLALAALSMSGYHYTAVRLLGRLWSSAALIVALVFGRALALRWLLVSRRRYAMEQARQQREAREAAEAGATPQTEEDPADRAIRLATINEQTRQLVNVTSTLAVVAGLYVAWIDIFPALGILNTVVLWTKGQSVVTLANLGSMLLLLAITFVAARNLPGLLEITLLLRLSLKTGQRFAITTLARYVVIIIGMVVAFQQIGVSWSSVQWLAAAVTVGLGFGLQEIFANFVSGLILLFEQPVRVGDVVTVGGVEGTVSRIQMRATTITDWNRKELIVPNKEFVTGQIINWTLTDQILRIVIPVGVAYGSDTVLVRKTLLDVASRNPRVLTDPPYSAWFLGFGDSALQFELRAFVRDLENFLAARHELNEGIDQAFRKAGVEIAFPQQDLHIRSITGPLPVEREIAGQD